MRAVASFGERRELQHGRHRQKQDSDQDQALMRGVPQACGLFFVDGRQAAQLSHQHHDCTIRDPPHAIALSHGSFSPGGCE